jgi:hypothetical protein
MGFLQNQTFQNHHNQSWNKKANIHDTFKSYYKDGGLLRLYRGSQIIACGVIPAHAMYFANYEYFKRLENK